MSSCPLTKNMVKWLQLMSEQAWWPMKGADEPIECPVSGAKNWTSEPDAIVKCPCDPMELEAALTATTDTKTAADSCQDDLLLSLSTEYRQRAEEITERKRVLRDPNYKALLSVLEDALQQAAAGKGKERHANDDPFEQQSICEISRKHGVAFATGQAAKKLEESHRLLQLRGVEAATNEILGAINYAAAAVIVLREGDGDQ